MAFGAISRHWTVWKTAWQAESHRPPGSTALGTRATEFLPAVLEIQQAPPSPIGRALLWTILAAFTAGVLWTMFGRIDIVATAQGKIIPSGYSKIIQPYEAGVIASIHVQDGQTVRQGDVLIELDSTLNAADRARASNEYRAAKWKPLACEPSFRAKPRLSRRPTWKRHMSCCSSSCCVTNWPSITPKSRRLNTSWCNARPSLSKRRRTFAVWKPRYRWRSNELRPIKTA